MRGGAASGYLRKNSILSHRFGRCKGQLDSMTKDIARDREEANDWLVKRLKRDKKVVFKRKGNERQRLLWTLCHRRLTGQGKT